MKTHKKLWLSVLLFLGSVVSFFLLSNPVFAEVPKDTWQKATFQFVDRSTIKATAGGETFDFIDVDPWDNDVEYVLGDGPTGCTNKINGLGAFKVNRLGEFPPTISKDKIHLQYDEQATGCSDINAMNSIDNASQGARTYFRWIDSERIESIDSKLAFDKDADGSFHVTESKDRCVDRVFVTEQGVKYFELDPDGENIDKFDLVKNLTECKVSGVNFAVYYDGGDRPEGNLERLAGISVSIANPENAKKPPQARDETDETPGVTGDDEACYNSGWELSWAACPVITAGQELANTLYEFVENQLQFTVKEGKQKDSLGGQDSREQVKGAWNNFRILVSGLVVILMLVMVISQAIGGGLFDAYTVKKMLPRLVIGVILIQLSWPIFSWVINFVDDLGRGLADIIYAPFGGADALNLNKIMEPFVGPGVIAFNWFGVLGIVALGFVAPFLILGLMLTVLVAIFAGFLTLLFRKILIILALITVPVALIAWMMPNEGLRRYWKLWWDNFLKALMMFPLIILIIAAGRIFAKIGSGQEDNLIGFFIILIGFFGPLFILPKTFKWGGTAMAMAGQKISDARVKALSKPKEYLKKQQEGYSALRDARSSFRYNNPDEYRKNWRARAAFWRRPIDSFKAGGLNPLLGLPGSELRARQKIGFVARGDEYENKQRQEAGILRQKIEDRLHEGGTLADGTEGGIKDDMYQDMLRIERGLAPRKRYVDNNGQEMNLSELMGRGSRNRRLMRRAALDRMAELGAGTNWRHVEAEHERIMGTGSTATAEERTSWRKFLNDNKTVILEKIPDLLKGTGSVSDINAEGISRMHGIGIERMLSKMHGAATDMTIRPGEDAGLAARRRATGQARLTKFLSTYNEALNNSNLRGNLEQNGLRAVKAFVTDTAADRAAILYRRPAWVHSDNEDGREVIRERTTPDGQYDLSSRVLLSPLIGADATGTLTAASQTVVNNIPLALRNSLDTEINVEGGFQPPTPRGAQAGGGGGATGGITWRPPRGSSTTPI